MVGPRIAFGGAGRDRGKPRRHLVLGLLFPSCSVLGLASGLDVPIFVKHPTPEVRWNREVRSSGWGCFAGLVQPLASSVDYAVYSFRLPSLIKVEMGDYLPPVPFSSEEKHPEFKVLYTVCYIS